MTEPEKSDKGGPDAATSSENPPGAPSSRFADAGHEVDPSLDEWITNRLREVYDPVLSEPLPEKLLKILKAYDRK